MNATDRGCATSPTSRIARQWLQADCLLESRKQAMAGMAWFSTPVPGARLPCSALGRKPPARDATPRIDLKPGLVMLANHHLDDPLHAFWAVLKISSGRGAADWHFDCFGPVNTSRHLESLRTQPHSLWAGIWKSARRLAEIASWSDVESLSHQIS